MVRRRTFILWKLVHEIVPKQLLIRQLEAMSSQEKKGKLIKTIGTHNGTFHCDEVLACSMLKLLPEFKDAEIVRSREPSLLNECEVVVDVGGVYDPATFRYDHHQRSFCHSLNSLKPDKKWTIKLSSAGLVYWHYGHRIIATLVGTAVDDKVTDTLFDKVYENFVKEIDAIDNGVNMCDGEKMYDIQTNLSSRVSYLNPSWNEKDVDIRSRFEAAMEMVRREFVDCVTSYQSSWLPARDLVVAAINRRYEVDPSGEVLRLDQFCPWKDHLFTLEEEGAISSPAIKFVLYEDEHGLWRVQCVPAMRNTFKNRLSLTEAWCGLRDSELCAAAGIEGCTFVHVSGFIGGNRTYTGALDMARATLAKTRI